MSLAIENIGTVIVHGIWIQIFLNWFSDKSVCILDLKLLVKGYLIAGIVSPSAQFLCRYGSIKYIKNSSRPTWTHKLALWYNEAYQCKDILIWGSCQISRFQCLHNLAKIKQKRNNKWIILSQVCECLIPCYKGLNQITMYSHVFRVLCSKLGFA